MHTTSIAFVLLASPFAFAQEPLAPPELETGILAGFNGAAFGDTVAIDGDRALITAPVTFFGASLSGSAWVYRWNGIGWEEEAHLDAPGFIAYQDFGRSADLSGDVAVVGVRYMDTTSGGNSGGAVVFERVGGAWVQTVELLPPPGSGGARYGMGVSVDGDLAVLSSDDAVYPFLVYERQVGGGWNLVDQVSLDGVPNTDLAGSHARIEGETLYLPAPYKAFTGSFDGEIQVWERVGTTWSLDQKIRTTTPTAQAYLGRDFDVDGDLLVASSPFVGDQQGSGSGLVMTFERVGGVWSQVDAFNGGPETQAYWGNEVALSGERLLVGQSLNSGVDFLDPPLVQVYRREGSGWVLMRVELDPAGNPPPYQPGFGVYGTYFGDTLAIDGDRAIVGARFDDAIFQDAGEAYAYDFGELAVDVAAVSVSAGGQQALTLQAGLPEAGNLHLVLGSFAGSSPGTVVGDVVLPLNVDPYLLFLLANPTSAPVVGGFGVLDGAGFGSATIDVPPGSDPALAGTTVEHAFVVLDAVTLAVRAASEAEALELQP